MNAEHRTRFLSVSIFFLLIASAIFTVPVRADSGSPPPAPTAPGGTTHSAAQVPAGAVNTAGGGDQGHKVELSSQNAAYIAPAGDPIWCPSGVAVPVPGAGGCSANYPNLYSLTNDVESGIFHPVVTNSNIWIQHGADTSPSQSLLNGSVLAALSNVSLNFKGGWNGLGTGSVNPATPSIINGVGISIRNWHNNVTLSNITVNNASGVGFEVQSNKVISLSNDVAFHGGIFGAYLDNTGGTGVTITNSSFTQNDQSADIWGLYILSGGPITLTGVIVNQDHHAGGAYLDNRSVPNKAVVIKSSYFDNNQIYPLGPPQYGLWVTSKGAITLTNVSASGNYNASFATGALLDNTSSTTAAPVTLTGTNIFDSNANDGMDVTSNGKITSASINASTNGGTGVSFDNHTAVPGQPVMLTGKSTFNNNGSYGLNVLSNGAVLTSGLTAISNNGEGAFIFNAGASLPALVTLNGVNTFNFNTLDGLDLQSKGAVVANSLTALSNTGGSGAYINNASPGLTAPVTLKGVNTFNNNGPYGLNVVSNGAVLTNGLTAISNSGTGVNIFNAAASSTARVTLKGLGTFNNNGPYGLRVVSNGAVLTNGLTAISNSGYGAYIVNAGASFAAPVTLKGLGTFNKNGPYGLYVLSKGAVVANSLTALSNSGFGVDLDNSSLTTNAPLTLNGVNTFNFNGSVGLFIQSKGAVVANSLTAISNLGTYGAYIVNAGASFAAPVTLKGLGTFNNNGPYGLYLISKGAVLTSELTAISNTGYGAYIVNNVPGSTAPVTLKGLGTFNSNGSYGLYLISNGAVVTNSLTAISNIGSFGAYIDNAGASFAASVTLNGLNTFNFNHLDGLYVISKGAVVANSLTAISNFGFGVGIENEPASFAAPVTLKGLGTFNHNGSDGLFIQSNGAVVTNVLNAISNSDIGTAIFNTGSSFTAPVTLKGLGTFNNNGPYGLYVVSNGAVLTNGLSAISNAGNGVNIISDNSGSTAPVTLKGLNTFNSNLVDGLYVVSKGAVLTNGLTALSNSGFGVFMDNSTSITNAPVSLNGVNTFNFNIADGLHVMSTGAVVANSLTAISNSAGYGVYILNAGASFNAPVTLKGLGTFNHNSAYGLYVISRGAVLTGALTGLSNIGAGAYIDNSGASPAAPVTLKGLGTFNSNGNTGLYLISKGAVITNGLTASSNIGFGVELDNTFSSTNAPVTLNGLNTFNNNFADGLYLLSKGAITTDNLYASNNRNEGVFMDNSFPGAAGAVNVKGKNILWNNVVGSGLDIISLGPVTVTNISSKWNGTDGLLVNTPGQVSVSCGKFFSNGTGHVTGYGWETGLSVPSITLIGVTSAGNFSGDFLKDNAGTVVTIVPHPCSLP